MKTTIPMKNIKPSAAAKEFNNATKALLAEYKDRLSADEMLAVTSHLVGVIVALCDQRKYTPGMAMELVAANIEAGNQEALKEILNTKGEA